VGIVAGYGLDSQGVGVRVPIGAKFFSSPRHQTGYEATQPSIQWVPGALSPGRGDAAEVKNMWIYTSTPPYVFMA
jgi:hypothetical protein